MKKPLHFGAFFSLLLLYPFVGWTANPLWKDDLTRFLEKGTTASNLVPAAISQRIVERFLSEDIGKVPRPMEDSSMDSKKFTDYVGRYDYQASVMTVSVDGDALFAQLTGQDKARIFPKSKDQFFWKVVDAEVTFLRDNHGKVTAARHTQNGSSFKANRLADDPVKLSLAQLDAYVGRYQYGPNTVMTVSRDGTQLFAELTGQPKFPIFPKSETEFEWRVVAASVRFVRGEKGKASKAVHTQNGTSFDAPKMD